MTREGLLLPSSTPNLLVSVRDASEAELAAAVGHCLIDAKDPGRGALGALPLETVQAIAATVHGRCPTSAVAGEPDTWDDLQESILGMVGSGVDMVKIAWPRQCGLALHTAATARVRQFPCPVVALF